jgi:hypothetical protein
MNLETLILSPVISVTQKLEIDISFKLLEYYRNFKYFSLSKIPNILKIFTFAFNRSIFINL